MTADGTEFLLDLLMRKLQEKNARAVHERLTKLMQNARRGLELRARYAPKSGRKFLLRPNATR